MATALGDSKGAFSSSWGGVKGKGGGELGVAVGWRGQAGGWNDGLPGECGHRARAGNASPHRGRCTGGGVVIRTKAGGNACRLWWGLFKRNPSG